VALHKVFAAKGLLWFLAIFKLNITSSLLGFFGLLVAIAALHKMLDTTSSSASTHMCCTLQLNVVLQALQAGKHVIQGVNSIYNIMQCFCHLLAVFSIGNFVYWSGLFWVTLSL
jgi:hypothetical protein